MAQQRQLPPMGAPAAMLDFDGTLADLFSKVDWSGLLDALGELYQQGGVPAPVVAEHRHGGWGLLYAMYAYTLDHLPDQAALLQEQAHELIHRYEVARWKEVRFYNGATDLVASLRHRGLRVGIITNNTGQTMSMLLAGHRIGTLVDGIIGRREPTRMKPYPHQIEEFLARFSCPPEGSFYLGDSVVDMQAADSAKVAALGVVTGRATAEELLSAGAVWVSPNLRDVQRRLQREGIPPRRILDPPSGGGGERERSLEAVGPLRAT